MNKEHYAKMTPKQKMRLANRLEEAILVLRIDGFLLESEVKKVRNRIELKVFPEERLNRT